MGRQREPDVHEVEDRASQADLKTFLHVILDHLLLIFSLAFVVGLAGVLYAVSVKPVYEANMTILIEETSPYASKNVLSEAESLFETKKSVVAEMELLRSRLLIGPVVDTLGLHIDVQPKYFPLIGAALAKARGAGEESMAVSHFTAAGALRHRTFVVTATDAGGYLLGDEDASFSWEGRVGVPLQGKVGGHDLEVLVSRLDASPGAQFLLRSVSKQAVVNGIQRALQVDEQGKQSGLVEVKLDGDNPEQVRAILAEIGREYLRQSVERRRADAQTALAFVDAQANALRAQLDQSDAEYSRLRHRHGTVNLAEEARVGVEQAAAAKARRAELQQRKVDLLARYGERHPLVVAVNDQLRDMDQTAHSDGAAFRTLPSLEQDEVRITRDIKIKSELYAALSNTAQQLRILAASRSSNARLVDAPALPEGPIKPNRAVIVFAAVMAGLLLGLVAAFLKRALLRGRLPDNLPAGDGLRISIPHSGTQRQLSGPGSPCGEHGESGAVPIPLLARCAPEDPAIEALRAFRAALLGALPQLRNNIVMLTAPTARLGKAFIAANAATVIAAGGTRVLLIDADLRKGHLQRYFEQHKNERRQHSHGLCEAVGGAAPVDALIWRQVMHNLDFLPAGHCPADPDEVLADDGFAGLLASCGADYELVIVNAPQVLGGSDAATIGVHAGAVFLVARTSLLSQEQIDAALRQLQQTGVTPAGILFNDARLRRAPAQPDAEQHDSWTPVQRAG